MIVSCSNPLLSCANTRLAYKALQAAELLVSFDITWTFTVLISDYVLPAACRMEHADMGSFASVGGYLRCRISKA
jgi:anaerobic selenocysteine-containing dehydrogenase